MLDLAKQIGKLRSDPFHPETFEGPLRNRVIERCREAHHPAGATRCGNVVDLTEALRQVRRAEEGRVSPE
ncbi:hypothetical protein [Bradyrhizobium neotropicale]|uniref:hypothetical protein n=1 Tax=Bradyrhizobium neotropicale TaxID=1497615 RepID=UPI001AD68F2A|nr:hypothetical protein [Bradyrhizobium neotropicale]MBO4224730.1 hypothetical protein [Bradyrhizobium neotropicale]